MADAKKHDPRMVENLRQSLAHYVPPVDLVGLYPYKNHPWTAQKLVSDLENRTRGARRWLEDNDWYPLALTFMAGVDLTTGVYLPAEETLRHHVTMTVQEVAVHQLWDRNRIVMDIHKGMTEHLRSSDSDKFPPMVLKHLPYPNPLVFLGSPVTLRGAAGEQLRLIGWYVAGMTSRQQYVDTTDDRAVAFHLTAISEVLSEDGQTVLDWDYCRITLPITGADATLGEIIEQGLNRFQWDPSVQGQTPESQRRHMSELLHVLVPHMLYLVSQNLEAKPKPFHTPPAPRRNKWDKKQGGGRVNSVLVGFESGPVLASPEYWGNEVVEATGDLLPLGATARKAPRAHWRRAHFHTYWAGRGSKDLTAEQRQMYAEVPEMMPDHLEKRVKWLPPQPINVSNKPITGTDTKAIKVR